MTNGEAVNWIINIMSDIGKAEHQELWHYEQALAEIREMLESTQPERKKGKWEEVDVIQGVYDIVGVKTWASVMQCDKCKFSTFAIEGHFIQYNFCPSCGADMRGEDHEVD